MSSAPGAPDIGELLRELAPQVLGALVRRYGEFGACEDAVADAMADAARAKLVRRENGLPAVTDGPYLETKEYLASFWLLDCESEERALQIAADMPFADTDPVEVWPVLHESAAD